MEKVHSRLNQNLNLSDSIYNYNFIIFYNTTNSIRAILLIVSDLQNIRAGGICVTDRGNFGSVGVYGTIKNSGMAVNIEFACYMTHGASTDHSSISNVSIGAIQGYR